MTLFAKQIMANEVRAEANLYQASSGTDWSIRHH